MGLATTDKDSNSSPPQSPSHIWRLVWDFWNEEKNLTCKKKNVITSNRNFYAMLSYGSLSQVTLWIFMDLPSCCIGIGSYVNALLNAEQMKMQSQRYWLYVLILTNKHSTIHRDLSLKLPLCSTQYSRCRLAHWNNQIFFILTSWLPHIPTK